MISCMLLPRNSGVRPPAVDRDVAKYERLARGVALQLMAQGRFDDLSQRGAFSGHERLRLGQHGIGNIDGCLHMGTHTTRRRRPPCSTRGTPERACRGRDGRSVRRATTDRATVALSKDSAQSSGMPSSGPIRTSDGMPRMVRVAGTARTVRRIGITSSRENTRKGRRPSRRFLAPPDLTAVWAGHHGSAAMARTRRGTRDRDFVVGLGGAPVAGEDRVADEPLADGAAELLDVGGDGRVDRRRRPARRRADRAPHRIRPGPPPSSRPAPRRGGRSR